MTAVPSIVKGHSFEGAHLTTTHIFVVADEEYEGDVLQVVREWVSAGVLEPALWMPSSWLDTEGDGIPDPEVLVFGRGSEPEDRRVSLLEALAREPHTEVIVTVINSVETGEKGQLQERVTSLIKTLVYALPQARTIGLEEVPGTKVRVINVMFVSGGSVPPGIKDHVLSSEFATIESFVINPEDRPTPDSVDVIPRRESDRWPSFLVSTAATVSGCWSSLASPLIERDATWVDGNVRVLRTFARVVLIHPLLAETAESTRRLLLGNDCAAAAPDIQADSPRLAILSGQELRTQTGYYVDWLFDESGLGYRPIEEFTPPSRRKRGLFESMRDFGGFAKDRLGALPRWIIEMRLSAFNEDATRVIYGKKAEIDIEVRRDLNRGVDDPVLVDAWDFVAEEQRNLQAILDAPTDPPEESDNPEPWLALNRGIALFAEGSGNEHDWMQTSSGIPLVAERLSDVIPPPDDEFTIDAECDALLGGDGTGQQVSWLDMEGATRLDGLLQRLAAAKRRRMQELRQSYLETESDFFSTLEGFMEARFAHEDMIAQNKREERIAAVDFIVPDAADQSIEIEAQRRNSDLLAVQNVEPQPGIANWESVEESVESRILVWYPHGFAHLAPDPGSNLDSPIDPGNRDETNNASEQDEFVQIVPEQADEGLVDPFASPLDQHIARPEDLGRLRRSLSEAEESAMRAQRLRLAMNDVSADEADRLQQAEHDLQVLERTQGELGRWMEGRSESLVGRVLHKVRQTSYEMDALVFRVTESAQQAAPEFGKRSLELQRRFVASIIRGVSLTLLIVGLLYLLNRLVASQGWIPGFTGIAWWWFVIALVVVLFFVFLIPLVSYFQDWTRERLRATDSLAHLRYQTQLVTHVKTERLRLAQLHMQVPQRIRALSCWWHFWNSDDEGQLSRALPDIPGCERLPFHLRWATSNWTHSQAFRQLQTELISRSAVPGYRSRLVTQACEEWSGSAGRKVPLTIETLARIRSSDALSLVEDWRNDPSARALATEGLEREIARQAQELTQSSIASAPHVDVLNPDPLGGMNIETDLLVDTSARLTPTDEFLLEVATDAAEMGNRIWAAAVDIPKFESYFAGPRRLEERLAESVTYVDAESSKVCSSEVAVRVDITHQIQIQQIRDVSIDEEEGANDRYEDLYEEGSLVEQATAALISDSASESLIGANLGTDHEGGAPSNDSLERGAS